MKIYLAGPDVFRPDAQTHGERLKALCARHGFEGLFPLDATLPREAGAEAARSIYRANIALIREADLVMANLTPFRGQEPDSGTAFEVGFAAACGKPVWAYVEDDRSLAQRLGTSRGLDGEPLDDRGYRVEDFGLPLNLMLACSATVVHGGPQACLRSIAAAHSSASSFPEFP